MELKRRYADLCSEYHARRLAMTATERQAISDELADVHDKLEQTKGGDRG